MTRTRRSRFRDRWGRGLLMVLGLVLALVAAQRLADGVAQLVWEPTSPVDLKLRWREVHRWFAGEPVYNERIAVYPAASYPMLWPALGWLDFSGARWLWAITSLVALGWLARTTARASGVATGAGLAVAALLPLAVYPARAVMVNGQLAIHLLALLLAGVIVLDRYPPSWARDLAGGALLLVALTKPTLTAPLLWILASVHGPLRPAAVVGVGYLALTAFAVLFQPAGVLDLLRQFAGGSVRDAARASAQAHANVHSWLHGLGLGQGHALASLVMLAALGWWMYRARGADLWTRLGVAALVARFWTFHYRYDDILVVVPLIALMRMVTQRRPDGEPPDHAAVVVLALTAASVLVPARLLFDPWPWKAVETAQTLIWLGAFGLLIHRARASGTTR